MDAVTIHAMSGSKATQVKVLFVTAEAAPFFQVGGLGMVSSELPAALRKGGHDVRVLMPLWRAIGRSESDWAILATDVKHDFGGRQLAFDLVTPDGGDTVFLKAPEFFETASSPYDDIEDPEDPAFDRWLFFSSAVVAAARAMDFIPEVLQLNDWHTAAAAALIRCNEHFSDDVAEMAIVLTIHNASFEGLISPDDWRRAGFREDALQPGKTMIGPDVSLLLAGIHFADRVTTVSPTYAKEIQRGDGLTLQGKLKERGTELAGILNGIDTAKWDPSNGEGIAQPFAADDLSGKRACRSALIEELHIDNHSIPLFGMIGRLTTQKGIDLLLDTIPQFLMAGDLNLVVLGKGESELEEQFRSLAEEYPNHVTVRIDFDADLARRIEAGADFFLMPSRFEPCGLNQLISQRYGTIPVVHLAGGLADSVVPHGPSTRGKSTGIAFHQMTSRSLSLAIHRALSLHARGRTEEIARRLLQLDLGWETAIEKYLDTYQFALNDRALRAGEAQRLSGIRLEPDEPYIAPLRDIPTHFRHDYIRLMVRDARTLYAYWEVSGPHGRSTLDALKDQDRFDSHWWIELKEPRTGEARSIDVEAYGKNWFIDVTPGSTWEALLWMQAGDDDAVLMARSEAITLPREWEKSL